MLTRTCKFAKILLVKVFQIESAYSVFVRRDVGRSGADLNGSVCLQVQTCSYWTPSGRLGLEIFSKSILWKFMNQIKYYLHLKLAVIEVKHELRTRGANGGAAYVRVEKVRLRCPASDVQIKSFTQS